MSDYDDSTPSGALISKDGVYRYLLHRRWDDGPLMRVVMLNPSTADDVDMDPTVRRVRGFAVREGYSGLLIGNLFALRATDPKELKDHDFPMGHGNRAALAQLIVGAYEDYVLCGWGSHPYALDAAQAFLCFCRDLAVPTKCLGINDNGSPKHPLYLPSAARLRPIFPDPDI